MLLLLLVFFLCLGFAPQRAWAEEDLFTTRSPRDLAAQVLDFLFSGTPPDFNQTALTSIQQGLKILLGYYSGAMLVFACIIVLYHLSTMVAQTAHYGVPFGKRSRQLWVPVRLVLALGLLVPLMGGLNSGQLLVMQIARWGSGLASHAWTQFSGISTLDTLTLHGLAIHDPSATVANYVAIGMCAKAYEVTGPEVDPSKIDERVVVGEHFRIKIEDNKPVSRITYYGMAGGAPDIPVECGTLVWLENGFQTASSPTDQLTAVFAGAHLLAMNKVQNDALALGGQIIMAALGTRNISVDYSSDFEAIVRDYRTNFIETLKRNKLEVRDNTVSLSIQRPARDSGDFGWLMAGAAMQNFVLRDGMLYTPDLAAPVVSFSYPYHVAPHDKAGLHILHALQFARLALSPYDPNRPRAIWFNPQIDHSNGPLKQAMSLLANVLARHMKLHNDRPVLSPSMMAESSPGSLFAPMALGFQTLDLADQMLAVAEWSPRANSPVFGPSVLFANMAQAVNLALFAGNPNTDIVKAMVIFDRGDQPADFARYLVALLALPVLIPSLLLVFILPLLPLFRFLLGALVWLVLVVEGLAAMPVWALTFLTPHGDELVGNWAKNGLMLMMNIFLRPILMVVGFIAAILMMNALFALLQFTLGQFSYDGLQGGRSLYMLGAFVILASYLILSYAAANISLRCIDSVPNVFLRWFGHISRESPASEISAAAGQAGSDANAKALADARSAQGGTWEQKIAAVLEKVTGSQTTKAPGNAAGRTSKNATLMPQIAEKTRDTTIVQDRHASAADKGQGAASLNVPLQINTPQVNVRHMSPEKPPKDKLPSEMVSKPLQDQKAKDKTPEEEGKLKPKDETGEGERDTQAPTPDDP